MTGWGWVGVAIEGGMLLGFSLFGRAFALNMFVLPRQQTDLLLAVICLFALRLPGCLFDCSLMVRSQSLFSFAWTMDWWLGDLHPLHSSPRPLSTLYTPHSLFHTPLHVTLRTLLATLHSPLSTLHSPLSTLHSPLSTLHSLHSPLSTLHSPLSTLHSPLSTVHSHLSTSPLRTPLSTLRSPPLSTLHCPPNPLARWFARSLIESCAHLHSL